VTGITRRGKRLGREKETDEMRKGSATIGRGYAVQKSMPQVGRGGNNMLVVSTVL
jgi:hypothetical protein